MAGYRPKSLEDINQSYDSEMSVTRAIKRETTKLSKSAPSVAEVFSQPKTNEETNSINAPEASEKPKHVEDLSFAVEDFIKQLSGEPVSASKPKVQISAPVVHHEAPARHEIVREEPKTAAAPVVTRTKAKEPVVIPDPVKTRTDDDFSSLMSDYVKIMNDLDDETTEKKGFLAKRRAKRKAAKKEIYEEISEEISDLPEPEEAQEERLEPEVSEKPEENISDAEALAEEFLSAAESNEAETKQTVVFEAESEENEEPETEEYFGSFAELLDEDVDVEASEEPEKPVKEKKHKSKKEKKADKAKKRKEKELPAEEPEEPEDPEETAQAEEVDEAEPEMTEEQPLPENDFEEEAETKVKKPHNGARIFFRTIFSLILTVCILVTVAVGSMGMVFHVNEGVKAPGNMYFFTTSRDFEQTNIKAGDLVICKAQGTANDMQRVVYVDRESRIFSFGVKSGSVTGTDGEIYYVIGESTVMRENVLGTVSGTVPVLGKIINLAYSYYIPVLAVLLVVCIALFLIVTVALRNRHKASDKYEEYEEYDNYEEFEQTDEAQLPEADELFTADELSQENTQENSEEFTNFFVDL